MNKQGYLAEIEESFINGRRVLAVFAEQKRMIKGILHGESDSRRTAFIEPEETTGLKTTPEVLSPAPQGETPSPLEGSVSAATGHAGQAVQVTASHDLKACADSTVAPKPPLSETTDGQQTS